MSVSASVGGVDLLTRTTLQIDGSMSTTSIAHMIQALQRVPGVLLAEVDAVGNRATVAHDAAVPTASFLAAAAGAGVYAGLVVGTPVPSTNPDAAMRIKREHIPRYIMVWVAAFVAVSLIEALIPNSPAKHWVLPVLMTTFWMSFLIAQAFGTHRA
jgi:hypothetical protein